MLEDAVASLSSSGPMTLTLRKTMLVSNSSDCRTGIRILSNSDLIVVLGFPSSNMPKNTFLSNKAYGLHITAPFSSCLKSMWEFPNIGDPDIVP